VLRSNVIRACVIGCLAVGFAFAGLAAASTAAGAESIPATGGEFVPVTAVRLVDSSLGVGWSGKLQPDATRSVTATGLAGFPTAGVLAVMLHIITAHSASTGVNANGNVWAWPAGSARPQYANLANPPLGSTADNTAIVRIGTAGQISFYNGAGGTAVDVQVDVEGYVTSDSTSADGAAFAPLQPRRIVDTADGTGGRSTPLTSTSAWTFHALGAGGIPATGVSAVALNLGAQRTSTQCWVQVQPTGTSASNASYPRVNTYANYTAQELAVVAPDSSGNITFSTNCASTDVYVDVEGYYLIPTDESSGDIYVPITTPTRVIDTRRNIGITGKMTAGRVVSGAHAVTVAGVGEVPSDADAVALNVGAINADKRGYNTVWTDGMTRPARISTINIDPRVNQNNLVFVQTGARGKIDVADPSAIATQSNDLYLDVQGYFYRPASGVAFATPQYFPNVIGDTFYNTVGPAGDILATANDTRGVNDSCLRSGKDIAILSVRGADPARLTVSTVNCMKSYGPRAGGPSTPDGCSWKTGGITRVGRVIYLAVARQLKSCSDGKQTHGLQPSFDASIIKSVDGGKTWTNPWGLTARDGAAPPWEGTLGRYKAMFPGQSFSAPFFIQYGPGNTQTVDGADKYLYSVSNDGIQVQRELPASGAGAAEPGPASERLAVLSRPGWWRRRHMDEFGRRRHASTAGEEQPQPAGDPVRSGIEEVRVDHVLVHPGGE